MFMISNFTNISLQNIELSLYRDISKKYWQKAHRKEASSEIVWKKIGYYS